MFIRCVVVNKLFKLLLFFKSKYVSFSNFMFAVSFVCLVIFVIKTIKSSFCCPNENDFWNQSDI